MHRLRRLLFLRLLFLHLPCALILAAAAAALAAAPTLTAPPDRVVLPDEFVTLVFRVSSDIDASATVAVTTTPPLEVIGSIASIELEADTPQRIALTVHIPADMRALTLATIRISLRTQDEVAAASVQLTVGERRGVTLSAPSQVTLEEPTIGVTLANVGNVEETVLLRAFQAEVLLTERTVTLSAGESTVAAIEATVLGTVRLELSGAGIVAQERLVRVLREGVPPPPELTLHGVVALGLSSAPRADGSLMLRGPLSDYLELDAELDLPKLGDSYLDLDGSGWTVRLGNLDEGPHGLRLPVGLGARGRIDAGPFDVGAGAGWHGDSVATGYVTLGDRGPTDGWGVAAGMDSGAPLMAAHYDHRDGALTWRMDSVLARRDLSFSLNVVQTDATHEGNLTTFVAGKHLLQHDGAVSLSTGYADRNLALFGAVDVPLGEHTLWRPRAGVSVRLPLELPGSLFLQAATAPDDHAFSVTYAAILPDGWQTSNRIGTVWTPRGQGLLAATAWNYHAGPGNEFGVEAQVGYFPDDGAVTGGAEARYSATFGDFATDLEASWDIEQSTLGISGSLAREVAALRLELTGNVGLDDGGRFTAGLDLRGTYAFDLATPERLIEAAGGRRLGTVRGRVFATSQDASFATASAEEDAADDGGDDEDTAGIPVSAPGESWQDSDEGRTGLAGISVRIDGATLRTDAEGRFEALLPPGPHDVGLVLATVPVQYRVDGPVDRTLTIKAKRTTIVDFPVTAASAVRGRLLLDSDGDGTADEPATPARGTVRLTSGGLPPRLLDVDDAGRFETRGMPPGRATVELVSTATGATVVGERVVEVTLRPGAVAEVTLLVQPAAATALTFARSTLRVRRVEVETDRVPPGTAPVVRVTVQGEPRSVTVRAGAEEVALVLEGEVWLGRLPVPMGIEPGVLPIRVTATGDGIEATRNGQVIVDTGAAAVVIDDPAATRAGSAASLNLTVFDQATSVRFAPSFGPAVAATEVEPGRWSATVAVPADTPDAVYEIPVIVDRAGHEQLEEVVRLRVFVP